jgi:hypothetical protein
VVAALSPGTARKSSSICGTRRIPRVSVANGGPIVAAMGGDEALNLNAYDEWRLARISSTKVCGVAAFSGRMGVVCRVFRSAYVVLILLPSA